MVEGRPGDETVGRALLLRELVVLVLVLVTVGVGEAAEAEVDVGVAETGVVAMAVVLVTEAGAGCGVRKSDENMVVQKSTTGLDVSGLCITN